MPTDTALFGATNQPNISFSELMTTIGGWTFGAGAGNYTFTNGNILQFTGAGIQIVGGTVTIDNNESLEFRGDSTAGAATIDNANSLSFFDTSGAGTAKITNEGDATAAPATRRS